MSPLGSAPKGIDLGCLVSLLQFKRSPVLCEVCQHVQERVVLCVDKDVGSNEQRKIKIYVLSNNEFSYTSISVLHKFLFVLKRPVLSTLANFARLG